MFREYEMKHIATLPPGVTCVGIIEFQGKIIVALTNGVYKLHEDGVLRPIPIDTPQTEKVSHA